MRLHSFCPHIHTRLSAPLLHLQIYAIRLAPQLYPFRVASAYLCSAMADQILAWISMKARLDGFLMGDGPYRTEEQMEDLYQDILDFALILIQRVNYHNGLRHPMMRNVEQLQRIALPEDHSSSG